MLHALDYILLIGILLVSIAIGIYNARSGGQQRTRAEFILNNRQLPVLPTVLSFMVSFQSAISVLYSPAEYYQWGTQMWFFQETVQACMLLVSAALIVPMVYKLKITSVYEYLELRFKNTAIRKLASFVGLVGNVMFLGVTVLGPSLTLQALAGLPLHWGVIIMVGCCALYTYLGGIRAVIWTDVIQSVVMFTGLLFLLITVSNEVGGLGQIFAYGKENGRFVANLSLNPQSRITVWGCMLNGSSLGMISYFFSQGSVQRYGAVRSLVKARYTLLLVFPLSLVYVCLCGFVSAGVFAYFSAKDCDPFELDLIQSPNELLPFYVQTATGKFMGAQGLFLALVYSASLSTISTNLSGCSAILWEDHIQPWFPNISEKRATIATKGLVFVVAVLVALVAILGANVGGNIFQIASTLCSAAQGTLLGVFLVAAFSRTAEWRGTCVGCVIGFIFTYWIAMGSLYVDNPSVPLPPLSTEGCGNFTSTSDNNTFTPTVGNGTTTATPMTLTNDTKHSSSLQGIDNLYAISFMYYAPIGAGTTCIVSLIVSVILCRICNFETPEVSSDHVVSFKDILSCGEEDSEKMGDRKSPEVFDLLT